MRDGPNYADAAGVLLTCVQRRAVPRTTYALWKILMGSGSKDIGDDLVLDNAIRTASLGVLFVTFTDFKRG